MTAREAELQVFLATGPSNKGSPIGRPEHPLRRKPPLAHLRQARGHRPVEATLVALQLTRTTPTEVSGCTRSSESTPRLRS
jgi:hypothetical protein